MKKSPQSWHWVEVRIALPDIYIFEWNQGLSRLSSAFPGVRSKRAQRKIEEKSRLSLIFDLDGRDEKVSLISTKIRNQGSFKIPISIFVGDRDGQSWSILPMVVTRSLAVWNTENSKPKQYFFSLCLNLFLSFLVLPTISQYPCSNLFFSIAFRHREISLLLYLSYSFFLVWSFPLSPSLFIFSFIFIVAVTKRWFPVSLMPTNWCGSLSIHLRWRLNYSDPFD